MASAAGEKERRRVLVIGGTGYIGRYIVAASAREGHPTFALVRDPAPADPAKAAVLQGFRDASVTLVKIIKTRLRNKMEDDFLSNNMLGHIESKLLEDYNYDDIIVDFIVVKDRKVVF